LKASVFIADYFGKTQYYVGSCWGHRR
jgi:hypothetical protein